MGSDSELGGKTAVKAEDLWEIPVLLPRRDSVKNELANWFGDSYDRLNLLGTYNLVYNAAVMADSSGGAVLCMEHDNLYRNLRFVPLEPVLSTGAVLVWKKGQFLSPVMNHFVRYLRNAEKALVLKGEKETI